MKRALTVAWLVGWWLIGVVAMLTVGYFAVLYGLAWPKWIAPPHPPPSIMFVTFTSATFYWLRAVVEEFAQRHATGWRFNNKDKE